MEDVASRIRRGWITWVEKRQECCVIKKYCLK